MERFVFEENEEEEKDKATEQMETTLRAGRERISGEYEKSGKEVGMIEVANDLLAQELNRLGLDTFQMIEAESVHLLPTEIFKGQISSGETCAAGVFTLTERSVLIDKDGAYKEGSGGDEELFHVQLHEMTHAISKAKHIVEVNEADDGNDMKVQQYRSGYYFVSKKYPEGFVAFNEAVTEKLTCELMDRKVDYIRARMSVYGSDKSYVSFKDHYKEQIKVLDAIIERVAEYKREAVTQTWDRLKRGYFSGEMMHLRDIERAIGRGMLRKLAGMQSKEGEVSSKNLISPQEMLAYIRDGNFDE